MRRLLMTSLTLILFVACTTTTQAQNYDAILKSLKQLQASIAVLKAHLGQTTGSRPLADVDGMAATADTANDPMYQFASNLEQVAADLTATMEEAKKAEAARPKNPTSAGHGKVTFSGFFAQQYLKTEGEDETSTFAAKRARLNLSANLNPYATVKFVGEFASAPKLLESYVVLSANKHFSATFGQYKPPFGTGFLRAITESPFVNGAMAEDLGADRDIGGHVQYDGAISKSVTTRLMAGAFNGGEINKADVNKDKNFAGRAEFVVAKVLTLAGNGYSGKTNDPDDSKESISAYAGSAKIELGNNVVEGEYIANETADTRAAGWYIWGGHSFATNLAFLSKIQVVGRYELLDENVDSDNDAVKSITVGSDFFIDGKYTKLQVNYQINREEVNEVENNEFLVNLQLAF